MGNLKLKKFYDRILISNAPISQANGIYVLSPNLANGLRYYVKGADTIGSWAIAAGKESILQPFTWSIYLIGIVSYYYSTNSSFNSIFDLPAYPWECSWVDGNSNPVNLKLEPYANSTKKSISIRKKNTGAGEAIAINFIKILSNGIDSAIAGFASNDNATKKIFSTMTPNGNCCAGDSSTDPVNPVFTRSTTCWAKNIDTSPISPWNNGGGYAEPINAGGFGGTGTLISPRHVLLADHFYIKSGKKLIFVDMNNNCYIRTLSNSLQIGTTDIRIGVLDSDLPSSVSFCKVASLSLTQILTSTNNVPLIYTDQNRAAFIGDTNNDPTNVQFLGQSSNTQRAKFWYVLVGGDSGNPACFVYNNKLILLLHFKYANGGFCSPFYINEINSVMNTLGGGYNLSIFDKKDINS